MQGPDWPPEADEEDVYRRHLRTVERVMFGVLGAAGVLTFVLGLVIMIDIGGGRANLADRLVIAVVATVILAGLDTQATKLVRRHRPLLAPDPPWIRRFMVLSALGMLAASAVLLGTAWWLP